MNPCSLPQTSFPGCGLHHSGWWWFECFCIMLSRWQWFPCFQFLTLPSYSTISLHHHGFHRNCPHVDVGWRNLPFSGGGNLFQGHGSDLWYWLLRTTEGFGRRKAEPWMVNAWVCRKVRKEAQTSQETEAPAGDRADIWSRLNWCFWSLNFKRETNTIVG